MQPHLSDQHAKTPKARDNGVLDDRSLSMEELEEGRRIAALVVKIYGDLYRPIFDKFDNAILARQNSDDRLTMVLNSQAPIRRVRSRRSRTVVGRTDERSS